MDAQPLLFTLQEDSAGYEVSSQRVPMATLRVFAKDVEDLLRGDGTEVDVNTLEVSIVTGSLAIQTAPIAAPGLWRDLRQLAASERLDGLDKKRREVIERWQKLARSARHCVFGITAPGLPQAVRVTATTDFHADDADQWVLVERYLQGEIVEMGGLKKVNAHIRLQDGTQILVESEREVFRADKVNRLYKVAMARIRAEYNVVTRAGLRRFLVSGRAEAVAGLKPAMSAIAFAATGAACGAALHQRGLRRTVAFSEKSVTV